VETVANKNAQLVGYAFRYT